MPGSRLDWIRPYATGLFPDPPPNPSYPDACHAVRTQAWGSHADGTYVMAYVPVPPIPASAKVIIYLHGFAFGNPWFYTAHMEHLAAQGHCVFFPDYQKSAFADTQTPQPSGDTFATIEDLLDAAVDSFQTAGATMIRTAWDGVQEAIRQVLPDVSAPEIHLFGHSVGGLFALSWPHYVGREASRPIRSIVAADPIPGTARLPAWIRSRLPDDVPFLREPVDPRVTGASLADIPLALLIGDSDLFVKSADWQALWSCLATDHKRIYLSRTDDYYGLYRCDASRALVAYHNQSVTNTLLPISPELQLAIGGAGVQNDLRWRFVWSALDDVLRGHRADALSFRMGSWSNGKAVVPVSRWPQG